jgi:hypothetical protein
MRMILLVVAFAASAHAGPITAGASLGLVQSEQTQYESPDKTLALYGRIGITPRLAAQLEVFKIDTGDRGFTTADTRAATALAIVDLTGGHWVPVLLAGIGYATASYVPNSGSIDGHHIEAGLGLEYRADGGFVIGIDARLGERTIDSDTTLRPELYVQQPLLPGGQYHSLRLAVGMRF